MPTVSQLLGGTWKLTRDSFSRLLIGLFSITKTIHYSIIQYI